MLTLLVTIHTVFDVHGMFAQESAASLQTANDAAVEGRQLADQWRRSCDMAQVGSATFMMLGILVSPGRFHEWP